MNNANKPAALIVQTLAVFSFLGMIAWPVMIVIGSSLAGMGDGAPRGAMTTEVTTAFIAGVPALYLFLAFLSCLPWMQGTWLRNTGIAANVMLGAFILPEIIRAKSGALVGVLVFAGLIGVWCLLYWCKTVNNRFDSPSR